MSTHNERCVRRGAAAVKAWLEAGGDNDEGTQLIDIVADLCHWSESRGDTHDATEWGHRHGPHALDRGAWAMNTLADHIEMEHERELAPGTTQLRSIHAQMHHNSDAWTHTHYIPEEEER